MAIHAAAWDADGFGLFLGTAYNVSANASFRDSLYSTQAIGSAVLTNKFQFDFNTSLASFYFSALAHHSGSITLTDTNELMRWDSNTGPELRLVGAGTGVIGPLIKFQKTLNGTTWTDVGSSFNLNVNSLLKKSIRVVFGVAGVLKVHINSVVVVDFTGDLSTQTNSANRVILGGHTNSVLCYWSQCMVGTTPLNSTYIYTLQPNTTGLYAEWTGAYTAIDETTTYDEADSITVNTINARHSWGVLDPVTATLNNYGIFAFCQSMRGQVASGSTPTNMQFLVRTGAADFYSANLTYAADSVKRSVQRVLETNPQTAVAWTIANINAVESGVRAI